jgi:hypothetical protein
MDNQNTQLQKNTSTTIALSEHETSIAQQVFRVNQLSPWALTNGQIVDWTKTILELIPDATPQKIKDIVDKYILEEIEWNKEKGIQNITKYLKKPKPYNPNGQSEVIKASLPYRRPQE